MKRFLSLLLALILCLSLAAPVMAGSEFAEERYQNTVSFLTGGAVIKSAGTLWVWGQIGDDSQPAPQIVMDGAVSVSKGYNHCGAVKADGSLWMWGRNTNGQLGTGTATADPVKAPVKVMDGVQAVSCGEGSTLILKQDRTLWVCGRGAMLGTGDREIHPVPVKLMDNVVAIQANSECAGALKRDGSLWAWGNLAYTAQWSTTEKPRKLMDGVESFSLCSTGVLAVKPDGSVWHLGLVNGGVKGGSSAGTYHITSTKVMDGAASVSIAPSAFAVVKKDGTLWVWGMNDAGRLGLGETTYQEAPVQVLDNVAAATLSDRAMFVLKKDGNLWAIGSGFFGAAGYSSTKTYEKILEGVKLPGVAPEQAIPGVTDRVSYIFSDVPTGSWYEDFLQKAYDYGIVGGTSADRYTPGGQLNHGQIMVMAANLHSRQTGDHYDFQANKKDGEAWYQVFEDYCKAEGIIDGRFDGRETQNVSRDEMAYYFARTLEVRYYTDKKTASFNDVSGNPYEEEILTLAKADIVGGKGDGRYDPSALVTRAEASVFVSNILSAIGE